MIHQELQACLEGNRVSVNAVQPGTLIRLPHTAHRLPNQAVALEAGAEGDLPHPVTTPHPLLGLQIGQLVPDAAARRVPEPVERHPGGLHVPVAELEVPLELVQDGLACGMDAEVLEGELVVWDVGLLGVQLRPVAEEVAPHEGGEEEELLGEG